MRIVEITYHKPANRLIASLQDYCKSLMSQPQQNGIHSLKDLDQKLGDYIDSRKADFPGCSAEKFDVILSVNVLHQWYNLLHGSREISMISVFARPDDIEAAFRDYDLLTYPQKIGRA